MVGVCNDIFPTNETQELYLEVEQVDQQEAIAIFCVQSIPSDCEEQRSNISP